TSTGGGGSRDTTLDSGTSGGSTSDSDDTSETDDTETTDSGGSETSTGGGGSRDTTLDSGTSATKPSQDQPDRQTYDDIVSEETKAESTGGTPGDAQGTGIEDIKGSGPAGSTTIGDGEPGSIDYAKAGRGSDTDFRDLTYVTRDDELLAFESEEEAKAYGRLEAAQRLEERVIDETAATDEGDVRIVDENGTLTAEFSHSGQMKQAAEELGVGTEDIDVFGGRIEATSEEGRAAIIEHSGSNLAKEGNGYAGPLPGDTDPAEQGDPYGGDLSPKDQVLFDLEGKTGADLGPEHVEITREGDQVMGTLTPEGERQVAAENTPFQNTPISPLFEAGARLNVRGSQFREANVERAQDVTGVNTLFGGEEEFLEGAQTAITDAEPRDLFDGEGTFGARVGSEGEDSAYAGAFDDAAGTVTGWFDGEGEGTFGARVDDAGEGTAYANVFDAGTETVTEAVTENIGPEEGSTFGSRVGSAGEGTAFESAFDTAVDTVNEFDGGIGFEREATPAGRALGEPEPMVDEPTLNSVTDFGPADLIGAEDVETPETTGGTLPVFSSGRGAGGLGSARAAGAGITTGLGIAGAGAALEGDTQTAEAEVAIPEDAEQFTQSEITMPTRPGVFASEVGIPDPQQQDVGPFGVPEQGITIDVTDDPSVTQPTEVEPTDAVGPDEFAVPDEPGESPFIQATPQQLQQGEQVEGEVADRPQRQIEESQRRQVLPDEFIPDEEMTIGEIRRSRGLFGSGSGVTFIGREYDPDDYLTMPEERFLAFGEETPSTLEHIEYAQQAEATAGQRSGVDAFSSLFTDTAAATDAFGMAGVQPAVDEQADTTATPAQATLPGLGSAQASAQAQATAEPPAFANPNANVTANPFTFGFPTPTTTAPPRETPRPLPDLGGADDRPEEERDPRAPESPLFENPIAGTSMDIFGLGE
ncbi:MAG: hypothetical protein ACLFNI_11540, partial [Natronomonas sp.]